MLYPRGISCHLRIVCDTSHRRQWVYTPGAHIVTSKQKGKKIKTSCSWRVSSTFPENSHAIDVTYHILHIHINTSASVSLTASTILLLPPPLLPATEFRFIVAAWVRRDWRFFCRCSGSCSWRFCSRASDRSRLLLLLQALLVMVRSDLCFFKVSVLNSYWVSFLMIWVLVQKHLQGLQLIKE